MKWTFYFSLTVLVFSVWAIFALTVINPYFQAHVPGYVIGRLCIWEAVAFGFALGIAYWMVKKWGFPTLDDSTTQKMLTIPAMYGKLFFLYLCILIGVAIWQFWIFSQKF